MSSKISAVVRDIQDVDGKVVVFTQFAKAVTLMMHVLQTQHIHAVKVTRGESVAELRKAIESFTLDSNVKVLVIHSGSGAAGLTLTVAHHVFLLEPFLRAGEEAQALNRVHRIGQVHSVEAKSYFMRGTIEERIMAWRKSSPAVRVHGATEATRETRDETEAIEEQELESGLVVLASDDAAKSVATFSNEFLSYVLGSSQHFGDGGNDNAT
jgi:E3 ubiquitin-protein ligase SHPRH